MATVQDLFYALKAADAAGNVEDAQKIADVLFDMGYGGSKAKAAAPVENKSGFFPALTSRLRSGAGETVEALGELTGAQALTKFGKEQREKSAGMYTPTSEEDIAAAKEKGILPTAGAYMSKYLTEPVGEAVGSITGRYGAPMAIAGAGIAFPEVALPLAAAGFSTNAAIHTGENLMRQKEQGQKPDYLSATTFGIGQAAIDQFAGHVLTGPMKSIIGKTATEEARLLAPRVLSGELSADQAALMVGGKLRNVLQATAQNAVTGAGMMTADEALRRASAGQELTSPEALETYKQQAITAAELSPLFGLAHGYGQPRKARAGLEGVEKLRPPPPESDVLPPEPPPITPVNPSGGAADRMREMPGFTGVTNPNDAFLAQAREQQNAAATKAEQVRQAQIKTVSETQYSSDPAINEMIRKRELSSLGITPEVQEPAPPIKVITPQERAMERARNMPGFMGDQGGINDLLISRPREIAAEQIQNQRAELQRKVDEIRNTVYHPDELQNAMAQEKEFQKLGFLPNVPIEVQLGMTPEGKPPAPLKPLAKKPSKVSPDQLQLKEEPPKVTREATPEAAPKVKPSETEQLQAQDVIDYRKQQDAIDAAAAEEKKSKFQGFKRSLTNQEWADLGVEPKPEEAVIDRTKNPDNIGIGGEPIEKGGKVFASRKEALEAKKNTGLKDYLAIKTPDGYVLTPKLAEDFAREKKAASNLLGVSVDKRGYMDSLESIVSNGGLRPEIASETKYADQNPRIGGKYLFQKNGMTLEQAGEHLREMGYELPETFYENDVLRLIENPTLTPDGYEKLIRAESKRQEEDLRMAEMESDAHLPTFEEFGYEATDLEAAGADRAPAKLQAEARELMLQAEKAGIDLDELTERVFYETRNQDEAAYHSALVREITNALETGRVTFREPVNRETEKVEPTEQEEFNLKAETPDEVRAKQAAAEAKAAEEARAAKEAEDKAKADAEVGEFTLAGSDREADIAAGRGQKDIFAEERRAQDNDIRAEIPEVKPERAAPPTLDESKVTPAKGRHPQVQAAMMLLEKGKMSREEFNKYVDHYRPIEAVEPDKLHAPTTTEAMKNAVRGDAKLKVNTPIAEGKRVGLRMDLPARDKGAAVVSIHEGKPNDNPKTGQPYKSAGDVISYANAAHITDVEFAPRDQDKSMTMGYLPVKEPLQTAEGKWVNTSTEEIFKRTKELMGKEGWTQVGFDPGRHGYFYDRETGQPVLRAKEVYQVGQFLLAKDVEFGDPSRFKYMQDQVKRKGTPEQIADRNERVSHYGGDVIYQNGDTGVYRTFNLTGDPLYRAFKGDNRLRGNLEDYSGKLFTEKERLTLGKAIEDWKKADAARFKKDPFVKFDKDGVAMSQSIPEDIAGVFKEWKKMLKLDKNIYLTTVEDTRANRLLFTGEQASIGSAGLHDALGMMQRMRNGDYFIAFKPNTSKAKMLETLGHEMGHIHELEVFNKQDAATKSAIKDEYQKWLGEQKGKSAQELVESLRARKTGKTTEIDPGATAEQLTAYWKSFGEWYADQTAKWATTQEKPLTVVEKFFSKLGAAMKAFYAKLRNGKHLPNETFRDYMNRVTDSMFDAADRPENMRPMVSDQMEMNFMLDGAKARAQQILQKRPVMNAKAFEGIDPNTIEEVNKIFYAPNKTIIDRIDSNKGRMWQWIAQKTVSEFRTAKQYSEEGFMKATMSKDIGGMLESLLYYGHATLRDGALDVLSGKDHKGLMDSLKPLGQEVDRFFIWMALNREALLPDAKRSPKLNAAVSKKNDFIKGNIGKESRAEVYEQARKDLMALNKSVLNVALETGLIDFPAYDRFASDVFFVPFYRAMEDGQIESVRSASRLSDQYFSKMLKGNNEKPFGDLMENTLRNWSHILSASMKNDAANTILRDAREAGVVEPALKAGLAWETDANGKNGRVVSAATGKIVGDGELVQVGKNAAGEETMIAMTEAKTGATDVVKTQLDGVTTYHHVIDPLLLDSIGKITQLGPQGIAVDIMRPFKDLLRFGVTASPMFKASNLIKDSIAAASYSDLSGNLAKNVYSGLYESKKESPLYQSALAGGAVFRYGTAMEGDRSEVIKRLIAQGVEDATILDTSEKIKRMFSSTWHKYQELGDLSENANRVALYKQMMEKGYSHLEASFAARDLMNFSAQGSSNAIRFVSATVPFFNARLQGLYKIGRDGILPTSRVFYNAITGKERVQTDIQKAKSFTAVTGAAMLASIALYMANKDDKDFKKREQWDRDAFWWAKIPGTDIAIRSPKPFEIGALATLVERSLEQMIDKDAETKRFTDTLSRMVWQTFSMNPVPQLVKPMVDVYANTNPFTGAPIETAGMEKLSKQERKMDSTSPIAVALGGVSHFMSSVTGEAGELSPVQVDYMIRAYMGWLGGTITATSVQAIRPFNNGVYPSTDWTKQMSLGFVESLPTNQSTYMTDFYQNNQLMQQSYADMRHYATLGQTDKVLEILKEKKDDIGMAKFYDATSKQLANIRKQILLISNPSYTAMDSDQKKQEIDRLKLLMSETARQAEEARKSIKSQ
jgi:hypothetical protein